MEGGSTEPGGSLVFVASLTILPFTRRLPWGFNRLPIRLMSIDTMSRNRSRRSRRNGETIIKLLVSGLSAPGKVMHARLADCTVVMHENHRLTR